MGGAHGWLHLAHLPPPHRHPTPPIIIIAVGQVGANPYVWLACWEAWVALHLLFSAAAHRVCRGVQAAGDGAHMYEQRHGWLPAAMWALLGVALPLVTGVLPFHA